MTSSLSVVFPAPDPCVLSGLPEAIADDVPQEFQRLGRALAMLPNRARRDVGVQEKRQLCGLVHTLVGIAPTSIRTVRLRKERYVPAACQQLFAPRATLLATRIAFAEHSYAMACALDQWVSEFGHAVVEPCLLRLTRRARRSSIDDEMEDALTTVFVPTVTETLFAAVAALHLAPGTPRTRALWELVACYRALPFVAWHTTVRDARLAVLAVHDSP